MKKLRRWFFNIKNKISCKLANRAIKKACNLPRSEQNIDIEYAYQMKKAIYFVSSVLEDEPNNPRALCLRATAFLTIGDVNLAISDLSQYILAYPNSEKGYILRAVVFHSRADYSKAILDLIHAISINAKSVPALILIADCYSKLMQNESFQQYEDSLLVQKTLNIAKRIDGNLAARLLETFCPN
ncbi:MAG: hypothetical protein Q8P11_03310 [bacterium]|nr:hypothetical protein [bacterium]